ncbi:MAG: hypothetical protein AUK55_03620 [Syntrophobacteraceae bacterium CG2_30_61_12]|nr:MAG: hypothetical protein AUK55_03620 [Syntrophobacteraceae bacterium CG2_30_61_12]
MNQPKNLFVEEFSPSMTRRIEVSRTIFSQRTAFQQADVVVTPDFGTTLFLDGRFQTSERDEFFYHESLVHPAMVLHPNPKTVLIIGGGDGGTLEEVCLYRTVERVRMVELDPEVVTICREHLQSICGQAFDDPRLELSIGDGRAFIEQSKERFDVILLDLTDPLEPSKFVYTQEFYQLCREHLNDQGILALHNDSPFFYPDAFNVISKTLDTAFAHKLQYLTFIPGYMLDFAFAVCSQQPLAQLDGEAVRRRLRERGIDRLMSYGPATHPHRSSLPGYALKILEAPCRVSTDSAPYVLGAVVN